jgi:ABC-type Fe3+ transport system substrate-binding protein
MKRSSLYSGFTFFCLALVIPEALLLQAAEGKPSWQAQWKRTIEAAEEEGEVVIYSTSSLEQVFRQGFQRKYPKIRAKMVIATGSEFGQRVLTERRAGKYIPDVFIQAATTPSVVLYPAKAFDPIRPLLHLPEVVDTSKWWQGKHHYLDPEEAHVFMFEGTPTSGTVAYNAKLVNPDDIKSFWDFLDPRWQGKIVARDPLDRGPVSHVLRFFYFNPKLGPEYIRRLFSETRVTISRNDAQMMDWLAMGKFAIAFFARGVDVAKKQGLPVEDFPTGHMKEGAYVHASTGTVSFFNKAPHPAAASVAINWLLSRDGQTTWLKTVYQQEEATRDSMRMDIAKPADARHTGA